MLFNRHLVFLYVTLAVSVGYFISALSLGAPTSDGGLTPSFFPILVGGAAIVFAGILIVQKLREGADAAAIEGPRSYTHLWVGAAIFASAFASFSAPSSASSSAISSAISSTPSSYSTFNNN